MGEGTGFSSGAGLLCVHVYICDFASCVNLVRVVANILSVRVRPTLERISALLFLEKIGVRAKFRWWARCVWSRAESWGLWQGFL